MSKATTTKNHTYEDLSADLQARYLVSIYNTLQGLFRIPDTSAALKQQQAFLAHINNINDLSQCVAFMRNLTTPSGSDPGWKLHGAIDICDYEVSANLLYQAIPLAAEECLCNKEINEIDIKRIFNTLEELADAVRFAGEKIILRAKNYELVPRQLELNRPWDCSAHTESIAEKYKLAIKSLDQKNHPLYEAVLNQLEELELLVICKKKTEINEKDLISAMRLYLQSAKNSSKLTGAYGNRQPFRLGNIKLDAPDVDRMLQEIEKDSTADLASRIRAHLKLNPNKELKDAAIEFDLAETTVRTRGENKFLLPLLVKKMVRDHGILISATI